MYVLLLEMELLLRYTFDFCSCSVPPLVLEACDLQAAEVFGNHKPAAESREGWMSRGCTGASWSQLEAGTRRKHGSEQLTPKPSSGKEQQTRRKTCH